jgi:metacaspase-1
MFKILSTFLFLTVISSVFSQKKMAFVIAIGEYAPNDGKGWKTISSVNDTSLILPALRKQGFEAKNTQLLINSEATIENIRSEFAAFTKRIGPKDIVAIHISAHGSQIQDISGDEIDGLDESIVTYNAILPKHSTDFNTAVKQYLLDDELNTIIYSIRKQAGKDGDVLVFMDNCHSGSGTRAVGKVRGGSDPLMNSSKPTYSTQKDQSISMEQLVDEKQLAPYVVISASRAEELNSEIVLADGKGAGSLSYAISQSLESMLSSTSYSSLYASIQANMNEWVPKQHPVIEGNGINRTLWGGNFVAIPPYIEVSSVKDERMVIIEAGILAGVTKESIIAIYPAGITDTTKASCLAKGKVIFADNFKSTVDLDKDLSDLRPAIYWAFIKKTHFPIEPITVSFQVVNEENEKQISQLHIEQYSSVLKTNSLVKFDGIPSLRIIQKGKDELLIDAKSDYVFDTIRPNKPYADELNKAIQRYIQYTFLKSYEIKDPKFNISVRLIPYVNNQPDTTLLTTKQRNGIYEYSVGDKFVVEITNHSPNRIYFNIVDIEPTGKINPIMPRTSSDPKKLIKKEELFVDGNKTVVFNTFPITLYPPIGDEIFKFFVSNKPLDMEYIAATKGENSRNMSSDLDRVFKNSFKLSTRGELGAKDGSVFNLNFLILPLTNRK